MKRIMITGASSGIGAELVKQYLANGCHVAAVARRQEKLMELQCHSQEPEQLTIYAGDVTSAGEMENIVAKIESEGDIVTTLIANAGVSMNTIGATFNAQSARTIFETNIIGVTNCIAAVLPTMVKHQSGHIVGISSLAAYINIPRSSVYCTSKAAVSNQLAGLHTELKEQGIAVTTICPGFVKTPMTDRNRFKMPFILEVEEAAQRIIKAIEKKDRIYNFPKRLYYPIRAAGLLPHFLRERIV